MGERRDRKWGAARWAAVLVVGTLVGSTLIGPAMAHLNRPLTFGHLKKHFYTKKASNNRFINVGEQATSAANADKLDGVDSAGFYKTGATVADSDKVDSKNASDLVAAGVFVRNVGGTLEIHRWFNNVNGQAPTLTLLFAGYYQVDFGFDARSRYAVCSIDPNAVATRNATCVTGTRWYSATPNSDIDVSLWDPQDLFGPAEFNLLVY